MKRSTLGGHFSDAVLAAVSPVAFGGIGRDLYLLLAALPEIDFGFAPKRMGKFVFIKTFLA